MNTQQLFKEKRDRALQKQIQAYILACINGGEYESLMVDCDICNGAISGMPFLEYINENSSKYNCLTIESLMKSDDFRKDISTLQTKMPILERLFIAKDPKRNAQTLEVYKKRCRCLPAIPYTPQ